MRTLSRTIAASSAVTALVLTGCSAGSVDSSGTPSSAGSEKDTVNIALTAEPQNLDFTTTGGAPIVQLLLTNVYEGLVKIDQNGEVQPQLAERWEVSDDKRTYTFTLREGVTFSDGSEFTSADVQDTIRRVQNDWTLSLADKMDIVESVEALSDTEVKITLSRPSNAWLFDMGTSVGAMMPSEATDLANQAIGTGPYTVTDVRPGDRVVLEARDDYWGDAPAIQTVNMRYFADAVATTNALRSGDVDLVYNIGTPDLIDSFASDDAYSVTEGTTNREIVLAMNNQAAPFDDQRVREAVRYAIDKQAVVDTAWGGYGQLIGSMVPPHDPYYEDLTDLYPHDPDKARQLLAEAGAENLSITWKVPTLPYATAVVDSVVSQLADVGIKVTVESTEFPAVWLDTVWTQKDYQMTVIGTTEARDMLTTFADPEAFPQYDNPEIAELAATADQGSEEEYLDGMKQIARTISEDAAADFLFLYPLVSVSNSKLHGVQENEVTEALTLSTLSWSE